MSCQTMPRVSAMAPKVLVFHNASIHTFAIAAGAHRLDVFNRLPEGL